MSRTIRKGERRKQELADQTAANLDMLFLQGKTHKLRKRAKALKRDVEKQFRGTPASLEFKNQLVVDILNEELEKEFSPTGRRIVVKPKTALGDISIHYKSDVDTNERGWLNGE